MTRQEAIDIIRTSSIIFSKDNGNAMLELSNGLRFIEALGMAIEALEQPHSKFGEWVDAEPGIPKWKKSTRPWRCSVCGHRTGTSKLSIYDFCPKCGSYMRGTDHD